MVPPFAFAHWVQQFAWLYMPLPDPTHPKSGLPGHAVPCANTRPRYSRGPDSPPSWSANPGAGDLCWLTSGSGASGREEDSGACCVDSACSNGEGGGDREVVPETTTLQRITQLSARRILRGCKPAASTARSARRAQHGKFRELSSGRFARAKPDLAPRLLVLSAQSVPERIRAAVRSLPTYPPPSESMPIP